MLLYQSNSLRFSVSNYNIRIGTDFWNENSTEHSNIITKNSKSIKIKLQFNTEILVKVKDFNIKSTFPLIFVVIRESLIKKDTISITIKFILEK